MAVQFNDWLLEGKDPEFELRKVQQKRGKENITIKILFPKFMKRHGKLQSDSMKLSYHYSFKSICRCPLLVNLKITAQYFYINVHL